MRRPLLLLAVFLGAFLVFQIQPLIGKHVLPWYGGTAAVWTTCLLVFQTLLFAGYAYAHAIARLAPKLQIPIHLTVLLIAAAVPVLPSAVWKPAGDDNPLLRIVVMLLLTVGLPYFVLSASGPLLQAWHWRLHRERSPYPLYALSNAGSLLALVSYPFLVEPLLSTRAQAGSWRVVFVGFVLLSAAAGVALLRREGEEPLPESPGRDVDEAPPPGWGVRLRWIGWAACGVMLFMAITNQLTLNVASVPFLWILPLALYLLAFIVAFSGERAYPRALFGVLLLLAVTAVVLMLELDLRYSQEGASNLPILVKLSAYAVALFLLCMICHGELYRSRPEPRHLTLFYLSIAGGGALGGIVVGAGAPLVLLLYQELQIGLLFCCLLYVAVRLRDPESPIAMTRRPWAAGLALLGVLLLAGVTTRQNALLLQDSVRTYRNFFGLLRVQEIFTDDPAAHAFRLVDGAIVHGYQLVRPDLRREPTTYYSRLTGVGRTLQLRQRRGDLRIGVVGLGVGTLAAYGRRGDSIRFYEINPDVVEVAKEGFSYLSDTAAGWEIALGDARLQLEREPDQGFDFLVLDAFSSDSIPVHLLTLEAFRLYDRHLAEDGVIAINISNLHLDLSSVVYRAAGELQLHALEIRNKHRPTQLTMASEWMVLSRDTEFMNEALAMLKPLQEEDALRLGNRPRLPEMRPWTDGSSSLLSILR